VSELRPLRLEDYLVDDLTRRVDAHLNRIAARDWDYFAIQKYRNDARQALSDFRRLDAHRRAIQLSPRDGGQPTEGKGA
jgi:hypothetical protein